MHKFAVVAAALLPTVLAGTAQAQTATQTVAYTVTAVSQIAVSGSPSLTINAGTAGGGLNSTFDNSSTYSVTTNEMDQKVTAEIDADMPAGLTLSVNLEAPTGASSAGAVSLSTTAVDVVTGISQLDQTGLGISYGLSASLSAGPVSGSRTVTYTILAGL